MRGNVVGDISDGENFNTALAGTQAARPRRGAMHATPLTPDALVAWLALSNSAGVPAAALRVLLSAFGDAQALLAQPFQTLADAAGERVARAVKAAAQYDLDDQFERTRAWCETPGNALIVLSDPAYPAALLTLHDPPPLLYVSGRLDALHAPSVAIVGSRNATPQGVHDAGRFARELAGSGLAIVSGLALGIDAAAHRGALDAGGCTIAVIGTGADLVYPARHRELAHEIARHGAIVSEWPLGTPAKAAHFPQRNRLIAGMSRGVLVVEAAERSGSLITARLANEMGRDVFAIPGSIHAPLARGCHRLIKDGAKLTETPQDVLEELTPMAAAPSQATRATRALTGDRSRPGDFADGSGPRARAPVSGGPPPASPERGCKPRAGRPRSGAEQSQALPLFALSDEPAASVQPAPPAPPAPRPPGPIALSAAAARVLDALGHAPAALEILAERTEMGSAALQGVLLELELRGYLTVLPGGRYVRHMPG
jgi:DNA processing protein